MKSITLNYQFCYLRMLRSIFNDTIAKDIVYFGATMATVTAASGTSLTVTVPLGATYDRVSVENVTHHLRGYEPYPFIPTYSNACFSSGSFTFNPGVDLTVGTSPYMAAIGDLDGDGKPDIVVSNKSSSLVTVYRNISTSGSITASSFATALTFTVDASTTNVKVADIDGDGKLDIITTHSTTARVNVLRNTSTVGTISFAARVIVSAGTKPYEVVIADFDGDGRPDIATADLGIDSIAVIRNVSTSGTIVSGSFSAAVKYQTGHGPVSIEAADVDGDGKTDIIVSNDSTTTISVLRNATTAAGSFTSSSFAAKVDFTAGSAPAEIKCADIDGDGKPDIIVANSGSNTISVFHNTATSGSISSSSFSPKVDFATGTTPESVAIADMDGDGKVDILVSNEGSGNLSIFRNMATSGTISGSSLAAAVSLTSDLFPLGVVVDDLDGDTKPDIVVANPGANTITIFRNNPTASLAPITGTTTVCTGATTTLSSTSTGGTWSLTNTTLATISAGGVVTGSLTGTDTAVYTLVCGSDTAIAATPVTISTTPVVGVVTGTAVFCNTSTNTLADTSTTGTWTSSNTSVATITSAGVITGLTQGTTIISYTKSNSCGAASDTMMVTVDVPAANITGTGSVCTGSNITLADATLNGSWTSSSSAVASVSATGIVTGATAGTAIISYTVTNSCGTTRDTMLITVDAPAASITGSDSVCEGNSITLADATSAGAWSSSNSAVGSVTTAGIVTGVTPGTVTISYSVTNSCGTTNATQTVIVNSIGHCDSVSAVPVVSMASAGVTTYPNPSAGTFTLRVSSPYNEQAFITISNITGEKVKNLTCYTNENKEIELYPAAGIYLIQVSTEHGKYNSKISIAR